MTDVIMLAILVAFFALSVVFVKACERIIGPDIEAARAEGAGAADTATDAASDGGVVAA